MLLSANLSQPGVTDNMPRCDKVYFLQDKGIRMLFMHGLEHRGCDVGKTGMFMCIKKKKKTLFLKEVDIDRFDLSPVIMLKLCP